MIAVLKTRPDLRPLPDRSPRDQLEELAISDSLNLDDEQWKQRLTPDQFHILREKGTERAFTGVYWDEKRPGVYACAGCGEELFSSDDKYDSGSGWPSFDREIAAGKVLQHEDRSLGRVRTEVTCARCGGHLGHVFNDGPPTTGLRYCINSAAVHLDCQT